METDMNGGIVVNGYVEKLVKLAGMDQAL